MAKKDYKELANLILKNVGGANNIEYCAHCLTRLRLNVKDRGLVKENEIDNLKGVSGTVWNGDQFQIIIGTTVEDVYDAVCTAGNLEKVASVDENLDQPKKREKRI